MVYFVSCRDVYEYPVYPTFLDVSDDTAWNRVPFEQAPETLTLNAVEREFIAKGATAMEHGYRVIGDEAPRKMLWEGGDRDLPEIIQRNCIAISLRLRDLIEQYEPGLHQFFPVEIFKAREGQAVATYYWLNVCNRIDSIDPERSNVYWKANYLAQSARSCDFGQVEERTLNA
ncbi:imm11 family protein [Sphingobium cupriresistens]|uniref:Immunity MXAN-0049 protein domain-containing protein n=1 Tax=Sphingobium cupriresistens LL01 TaxID=1420583 RepID=A0A0J8A8G5_9SPHN|nr:DUF1629 domain-containing protein [Sphingobium cupriresistens]KMS51615.1 hypothetical protein V473_23565 [Sphingobium cupriresistens LL01]